MNVIYSNQTHVVVVVVVEERCIAIGMRISVSGLNILGQTDRGKWSKVGRFVDKLGDGTVVMTLLSVQPKGCVCGETDDEIIGFWAVDNLLCLVVLCGSHRYDN